MNNYEMVTLLHPRLDDEGVTKVSEWIQTRIGGLGGEAIELKPWGKRHLAYPIKRQTDATYIQYDFQLDGTQVRELERSLRLNEDVLRHLVVRK